MITTLTPNPSLDRTLHIDRLERGEVNRVAEASVEAAGKGINVARALHDDGIEVTAVLPAGGADGTQLAQGLVEIGLRHRTVQIGGSTRTNVTVVEADGTVTKLNEPGPPLSPADVADLEAAALAASVPGGWLVMCGSLPPGCPTDIYARLVAASRQAGVQTAVDTSGPALAAAVERGPDLIKPNLDEFRDLAGRPLETIGDVAEAAARLQEKGVATTLVSLGREGALLMSGDTLLYGRTDPDPVRNTVGAGDALLAGYLGGDGEPVERLRRALAWAAAAVRSPTTVMSPLTEADFSGVSVESDFDPAMPLQPVAGAAT